MLSRINRVVRPLLLRSVSSTTGSETETSVNPYTRGRTLDLGIWNERDGTYSNFLATIRRTLNKIEANGCVMMVDLEPCRPSSLPPSATLKLFDRRFCMPGSDTFDRPWTPRVEESYRQAWSDVAQGKRLERPVQDLGSVYRDEVDVSSYDDWDIEMYRWDRLQGLWNTESQAYRRLQELQGRGIPRFYGTVQLTRTSEASNSHPSIRSISGLLLEFIEGLSLDQAPPVDRSFPPSDEDQAHGQAALNVVRGAHSLGVVHNDLMWQNVIRRPDASYAIIDWGMAQLRDAHHSEEDWLAIRAEARDLHHLRCTLTEEARYDPTPIDLAAPDPKIGYCVVNEAASKVKDPARRQAWFEAVPYEEPGYCWVGVEPQTYRYDYRHYRVRPGVRTRETYKGEPLSQQCIRAHNGRLKATCSKSSKTKSST